jgi:hypothetical protein
MTPRELGFTILGLLLGFVIMRYVYWKADR